jgi:hypothetical protein
VQVEPMKPMLKAPGTKRLKLQYDETLSNFAFQFSLRHYIEALTPPLLQRARLRAQQIAARREEEEEAEAERSRRGRGQRVGTRSEASVAAEFGDGGGGDGGEIIEEATSGASTSHEIWDAARLRAVTVRAISFASRSLDSAMLVGPGRLLPRHPTHFNPLSRQLNDTL